MNRNIFSLVFSKARNMLVVAPEIATGTHKSSRSRTASAPKASAFALHFVFAAGALAGFANCAHAQGVSLPSGSILDINNGTGSNDASYSTADVFQTYTVSYTATSTGANYLLFAFRQDPAYWTFGNVSLVLNGTSTNLLTDPTFTQGGTLSGQSGLQAPADWGIVYQTGTTPEAAGQWYAPGQAPSPGYSTTNVNSGTAGSWYDGAVGSFDGIYQGVDLVAGDTYTISFSALSNNTANTAGSDDNNGVEMALFAGQCVSLSASASNCAPGNTNFTVEATPSQTVNAGSTASNINAVDDASGLAANPATLLPVFDGGTLVLDGTDLTPYNFSITGNNGTVDLAGQSAVISNPITDNTPGTPGSLTIANSSTGGALTLTGANTYTGSTTINNGATLALSGAGSIATSSGVANNGVFDISTASGGESIANLSGNGTVNLGGNGLTITSGNSSNFAGTIEGSGGVAITSGVQELSGANTYTGATTINYGAALVITGNGSVSQSSSVNDNGLFDISGGIGQQSIVSLSGSSTGIVNLGTQTLQLTNASGNFAGTIEGNGNLEVAAGTETLSGNNTYFGETAINNGATLALAGNGSITNSSVYDNGTFDISQANGAESFRGLEGNGIVNLGNNNLILASGYDEFTGTIEGNGGVTLLSGYQVLAGTNTYMGGTTIDAGQLVVSSDANLGSANGALNFSAGTLENTASFTTTRNINVTGTYANFDVDSGTTLTDVAGTITGTGIIYKTGGGTLVLGADNASGGLDVDSGEMVLTGASTYTGATTIGNGAMLLLVGNGSINDSAGVYDTNGTFDIAAANGAESITGLNGSGTVNLGTNGLTLTNANGEFSGTIDGDAGLTITHGQEELMGTNTYTGGTTLDGGSVVVNSDANLGNASGALNFDNGELTSVGTFTSVRNINVGSGGAEFDIYGTNTVTDTAGTVSGSGAITKIDTGTLILGSIDTSGNVVVDQGTLQVTGASTTTGTVGIGSNATFALTGSGSIASATDVINNGTFDISGASGAESIAGISGLITGTVNLGNNGLTLTNANDTYSGTITGNGGLTMSGGVEQLAGNNTYTGGTTLNGGLLQVSSDANLGDASGALNFNGGSLESTATFTSTRNITTNGAGANFDVDGGTTLTDTAGLITGSGPINKEGTGTLILGADNANGGINVGAGALQLTGASTDTGPVGIDNGATLALTGNGSIASASDLINDGTFDISGANGAQSITGLQGNGTVTLGNNGLTFTNASDAYAGTITGNGGVTMSGGVEALSDTNTYTGGTTLNGGVLQVSSDANLGDASGALNFNGGTLESTATFTSTRNINMTGAANFDVDSGTTLTDTTGTITGNGPINKEGSGTLILGSDNSTGGVNIGQGTLQLTGASTDTGLVGINNGATLALSGNGSIASAADVINDGTFDISGANGAESITGLQGNGIVALGNNGLTLTNANDIYSGTITGNGALTMSGGVEQLAGNNTYLGGTTLNGGLLQVSSDANLGDASGALNFNGGSLESTATFTSTRNITTNGAGADFDVDSGTTLTDTAGAITGTGLIYKAGAGTLILGADNANGGVNVAMGTLQLTGASTGTGVVGINNGATLALTGNGSIASASDVINNGTLDISGANGAESITGLSGAGTVNLGNNGLTLTNANDIFSGIITGNGGVTVSGGVEALSGTNTYTGGTTLNGGALQVSSDANLGDASGALNFNGGTLESTATFTSTRNIAMNGAANFDVDSGTTLTDTTGTITGNGPINKEGSGTLILGTDSSTGGVNVDAGALQLTGASTDTGVVGINTGATLALTGNGSIAHASDVINDGTFDISGANSAQSIAGLSGLSTATVNLGNNGLTLTNANDAYAGTIAGNAGVTMNGGAEALSGNNTYSGGTTLNGGVLQVSSDANLGNASGALNFHNGTLESTATFTSTRNISMTGAANFDVDAGTTLTDTAGTITGNGPINKEGTGTLILGTDNSTGGVNVGQGTLQLTGVSTDTGASNIASGATLAITGNGSDASASSINNSGTLDISSANHGQSITSLAGNGAVTLGNNDLTLTNANGIYSGTIGGNGGVALNGGTEELSGSNTYTGGTTLNGGTLMVSGDSNLGNASGALNFNGGTLENTSSFTTSRDINATGAVNIQTNAGTTLTDTAGTITGSGPINKSGTGTLVLGADNSTGGVNIGAGTLQLTGVSTDTSATNIASGATLAITGNGSDASASSINNSGTVDISGASGAQSIASLAGNGTVSLGNNGLTLTNANGNFSGTIGGNGGVTMSGGTEVLSGNNTYAGGTVLNGGNLVVNSDANLGAAGAPVTFNGGTLTVTQSINTSRNLIIDNGGAGFNTLSGVTVQDSGAISGTGGLVKIGAGTLVVSGDNTFSGGTLIDGGVVQIDSGSSLGTGTILLNGGTLQSTATLSSSQNVVASGNTGVNVNADTTTVMAGNIQQTSGSGCFVKSGSGTLNFTGTEVLSGGTCVQQGMLRANGDLFSNVTVYAAGELRGVGAIDGPVNVSGKLAPGNSPGTLTVNGTVTMQSGSSYEEDIDGLGTGTGAGNYSRLIITGANNQFIANGTLAPQLRGITGNASNTYVPQVGDVYQIISAQGGIEGQFNALTQPTGLAAGTRLVAFYNVDDNHSIDLGVVPESFASLLANTGANRNALSVAGALDQALNLQAGGIASSGQSALLFAIADAKANQLGGVLTNLSGEVYADEAAAARATGLAIQSDTLGHLTTDDSDVAGEKNDHLAWANVSHDGNRWDGDAQGSAFQTGTNQSTAGTDLYAANGTVVGVAVSNHDTTVNAGAAQGSIRGYDGILYGQQAIASVLVDGMVAQGHDTWITRRPDPTGVAGDLYSRASGNNTMADLTARMPMTVSGMHVEPYASVTWQQFDRGGMSETADSPAALQVSHLSASGGRALLGVNVGSNQQDPLANEVTYRIGAALGADSRGLLAPTVQSTLESDMFQTKAPGIGSGFVQLQANGTLRLSQAAYLYGGLTDENGAHRSSYGVTAGLRVSF